MTLIWLIVWLFAGRPGVHPWNGWLIFLLLALLSDLGSSRR